MKLQLILIVLCIESLSAMAQTVVADWPTATRETKPWTRWWWHGSAVTKEGITKEMEAYKKAGLGGLEITPIYGVQGKENQFLEYLSPEWIELLMHTLKEAERLDLGTDMATGTGWPFGGSWVNNGDACRNIEFKTYTLKAGHSLKEKIVFVQQPYVRAVGNQVYEVHDSTIASERARGTLKEPFVAGRGTITIDQLVEPVSANRNLQSLALDQVKFEKALPLQALMAYSNNGTVVELTTNVDKEGNLRWIAPKGNWKLYAVFAGWHGKMVERAGPGGEGNVIDHFSNTALKHYLQKFDSAFTNQDIKSLRAFFNDSYEVDDARGTADWTPLLFEEFKKRRGYDLKEHLPALFAQADDKKNNHVLCDYRETISDLVLENFTRPWREWAHDKSAIVRNQAHGSPSNILDLYATVDIPEIEGVEPLRIKMASSAGNVVGKKLISSESATWLNEHFQSNLGDIKVAVDRFMLNGVNHIFYHGTTYSPPDEPWPGWLFYAAVHLNPRNSLWPHFSALNKYIERCQSLLQQSKSDNDVLLYYPVYDRFSTPGKEMVEHFDGVGAQFENTFFKRSAEAMLEAGYGFDYISDKQISNTKVSDVALITEGNSKYRTLVLPQSKFIPLSTLKKVLSLAEDGATIIMAGGLPSDVSGFFNLDENRKIFQEQLAKLNDGDLNKNIRDVKIGRGRILIGNDPLVLLQHAGIRQEAIVKNGLQFLRKTTRDNRTLYFISNGDAPFEGWVTLRSDGDAATLFNPMSGEIGVARTRKNNDRLEVYVQLKSRETIFMEIGPITSNKSMYRYITKVAKPLVLDGPWTITFIDGGPELPSGITTDSLSFWTSFKNPSCQSFSGCASYQTTFKKPKGPASRWTLDLGRVEESAEVIINGKSLGILIGPDFKINVDDSLLRNENILQVKVCNLMANRIAYMDKQNIFWKRFYNINFPARKAENRKNNLFDASNWLPEASGLYGPVKLIPVQ
jgi:hypothetical protein